MLPIDINNCLILILIRINAIRVRKIKRMEKKRVDRIEIE